MFRNELDMLQCRLEEFEDVDAHHILVEAPVTHQGRPKPLFYEESQARFARWHDRITHIVATDLPRAEDFPDPWVREHAQRDSATWGLAAADPQDTVIIADLDEIPSHEAMLARPAPRLAFEMGILGFAVDWVHPLRHRTSVSVLAGDITAPLSAIRDARDGYPVVADGGWHISWLGGPEAIAEKAEAFCHLELKDMIVEMNARDELFGQGWTWFHNEEQRLVEAVDSWPRYIREGRCPPEWFRSPARRLAQ
jgi:beta-1,4-mannosyl-glycoprotein beta-1,4-N-acetylglucosaminyltransferase